MMTTLALMLLAAPAPATSADGWTEAHRSEDLVVWTRAHAGTEVNEMRAVGIVDAPVDVLWGLVSDIPNHTKLLPNTTISEIIGTNGTEVIARQRSESPLLAPREYVIAVHKDEEHTADGHTHFTLSWHTAPSYAAAVHTDAVRIELNQGCWSVEGLPDGRSRITFQLLMDPAGSIPSAFVNFTETLGAQRAMQVLGDAARARG